MHTAAALQPWMFRAKLNGAPKDVAQVLPDWDAGCRFGVVVRSPLGAIGASLLIQLAICAYYETRPQRRGPAPHYPDVYALHVDGRFGALGSLDFWPPRKEAFVSEDDLLPTINSLAITHLATPAAAGTPARFAYKERETALDRLRQGYVYSPDGRVADANLSVTSAEPAIVAEVATAIDPEPLLARIEAAPLAETDPGRAADRERFIAIMRQRLTEVAPHDRRAAAAARQRLASADGVVEETYRIVSPADLLSLL